MRYIIKYFKNYKIKSILAPLFKMLEASFELLVPLVMAAIIDNGIKNNDKAYVIKMGLLMVALGLIGLICSITAQYFSAKVAMGIGKELRYDLFEHIESFSYTELDNITTSTLITRMTSDINQVQTGVNMFLRLFLRSPFIVGGATIMAFIVDAKTALVFAVALPILVLVVFGIIYSSIPLYKRVQEKLDRVLLKTRESYLGVRVIRAFNQQKFEKKEFEDATNELTKGQIFVGKISSFLNPLTYAVINLSIVAIIWYGAKRVDSGIIKQGEVYAIVNYMSQILIELVKLANLIITESKAVASANRIGAIFDTRSTRIYKNYSDERNTPDVKSGNKENTPDAKSGNKENTLDAKINNKENESDVKSNNEENAYAVCLDNVSLTYDNSQEPAISDVTLNVKKGETIGIIGGTGSGKTSLVNLITGYYGASSGDVFVNGLPINQYTNEQINEIIGIVPQKAVLFKGSIRDNIKWGKEDATDEEIFEAIDIACAREFVDEKEGKLDYLLNAHAKNLSGGQRQRLTIARALVKKPEILILDDSSSALDYVTDAKLKLALKEKMKNTTVFVISQRTSSIMHADNIVCLEDGKVVGIGTHERLLNECEIYQEIYYSQHSKKVETYA